MYAKGKGIEENKDKIEKNPDVIANPVKPSNYHRINKKDRNAIRREEKKSKKKAEIEFKERLDELNYFIPKDFKVSQKDQASILPAILSPTEHDCDFAILLQREELNRFYYL